MPAAVTWAVAYIASGQSFAGSKLQYIPHAGVVMAGRGTNAFFHCAYAIAWQSSKTSDFDSLDSEMPAYLQAVHGLLSAKASVEEMQWLTVQEIYIVGFSISLNRICCCRYSRRVNGEAFTRKVDDAFIGCWDASWGDPPWDISDAESMTALARIQVTQDRRHHPHKSIGGRLLFAEVTRYSVRFTMGDEL